MVIKKSPFFVSLIFFLSSGLGANLANITQIRSQTDKIID